MIPTGSALALVLTILLPEVTSYTRCPGIQYCNCSAGTEQPVIAKDTKKHAFAIIECSGDLRFRKLDFSGIKKNAIRTLRLRNTTQKNFNQNTFKGLNLEVLVISDQVSTFDNRSLESISKTLNTLKLENVNISRIWNLNFLGNLSRLETLYLDKNGIYPERFPDNVFRKLNLTSLKYLSLRHCGIARMSDKALEGLSTLETLDLSHNHLPTVPKTILLLRDLKMINLSYNDRLIYVEEKAFLTLHKLEEIDLSNTGVNTLLEGSFDGLENCLKNIHLHHAKMAHGYFSTMRKLRQLKGLDISYNHITEMTNTSFVGFWSLEELDISGQRDHKGNIVANFVDSAFRGLEVKLRKLKMRDLQMTSLPLAALSPLRYLHVLDISDNNFTEIYEDFFYGVKASIIYVQNCSVSDVLNDAFENLYHGVTICFDNNNITNISFILDTPPCQFRKLSFKSNPVSCDCDVVEIASTSRVPDLTGACADVLYGGMDLARVYELSVARNICDTTQFLNISGCSYMMTSCSSCLEHSLFLFGLLMIILR